MALPPPPPPPPHHGCSAAPHDGDDGTTTRESVIRGLQSHVPRDKRIPVSLLYDAHGTLLYERILAEVPAYYPYHAEDSLISHNLASIAASIPPHSRIVELGCGTATKTIHLLNAVQAFHGRCQYVGIDISGTAIKAAQQNILEQGEGLGASNLSFIEDDYMPGIKRAKAMFPDDCFCIVWLGSSIGNFSSDEAISLLKDILHVVGSNCLLFLCTDLWKEEEILYKAYCDDEGITELFIKNGMRNALSILGYEATDQEHDSWIYRVEINKELRRVEMWIIFPNDINIERHDVYIRKGEGVLVEFSRKFSIRDIEELANKSNFYIQQAWRNQTYSCQMLYSAQQAFWSCWSDTDALFDKIQDWSARPIDLRHPFLFYYGHVAAFASSRIQHPTINPYLDLDTIFSRGIDPCVLDPATCHDHPDVPPQWPSYECIKAYVRNVRLLVMKSIEEERLSMYRICLFLEHERMHLETLEYMLAQQTKVEFERDASNAVKSPLIKKGASDINKVQPCASEEGCNGNGGDEYGLSNVDDRLRVVSNGSSVKSMKQVANVLILPGKVSMGSEPSDYVFAWDNEIPRVEKDVSDAFMVSSKAVSIGEFMAFVEDNGYEKEENWGRLADFQYFKSNIYKWPATWSQVNGEFYVHGPHATNHWKEVKENPVYVSLAEAEAYCKWVGPQTRIMTEEEYHRASEEDGKKVMDLRSRGWEWTCSPFQGFPRFKPMEEYKEYSVDFFDGNHFVLKGSSPATHPSLIRDSLRNFYQRQYRYVFAKFRCCATISDI